MAKFIVCSVRDDAVNAFMQPFFARSKNEARRSFGDAVADPKMEFGKHPKDYALVCLGEWDDAGIMNVYDTFEQLAHAMDYVVERDSEMHRAARDYNS